MLFSSMRRLILPSLAALALTAAASTAAAFCQTYTCEFDSRESCDVDPDTGCKSGGVVAHWGSECISYAVQQDGSEEQEISPDELRGILDAGFRAWSEADCTLARGVDGFEEAVASGETPEMSATYRGETSCDEVEYNCGAGEANANIVVFRDGDSALSAYTIALSTIVANLRTGEILDVDIEINSQDFDFSLDPNEMRADRQNLQLVLNHELGHLLGLSHSIAPGALMNAAYDAMTPLPIADDIAGMCSIFPPSRTDPECSSTAALDVCVGVDGTCPVTVQAKKAGCALASAAIGGSPIGGGRGGLAAGLLAAAFCARRRRPRPFGLSRING
jgi:hypothetical protein